MDLWAFITTGTAPWWSALVGTLLGGGLTFATTRYTTKLQMSNERKKIADERAHQLQIQLRKDTVGHISDMLTAHYRYMEHALNGQHKLGKKYPSMPDLSAVEQHHYLSDLATHTAEALPMLSELQRIFAIIQITSDQDVAKASQNLIGKLNDHRAGVTSDEFSRTREDAIVASAILIGIANKKLSAVKPGSSGLYDLLHQAMASEQKENTPTA